MNTLATRVLLITVLFGVLFVPPVERRDTGPSQSATPIPQDPDVFAAYPPEVRDLLRTTYLGHGYNLPDPGEPVEVLEAYLAMNRHSDEPTSNLPQSNKPAVVKASYNPAAMESGVVRAAAQADATVQLDAEIAKWRGLVEANPTSRHAHLGLATLENTKADLLRDRNARRSAADHFIKAAELALEHGEVRHTHEVSRVLVELKDGARLGEIFSRILEVAPRVGQKDHYLALVDYADGLARLNRRQADARFEEAIRLYSVNNSEAINRYAQHLLGRRNARKALAVLDQMTPDDRQMHVLPVFLRKRALEQLRRDTSSADAEIELMRQRLGTDVEGGMPGPELTGEPVMTQRPIAFAHGNYTDDCRAPYYNGVLHCSTAPSGGWCWFPFTVNLGEIIWNEARGESVGAQALVAWTVRDRVLQTVSCDTYVGGSNYYPSVRDRLPCDLPGSQSCSLARGYCWAEHGGTSYVGQAHWQFNDAHVFIDDLANSGTIYPAFYVINGWMWDRSTNYIPPGVWYCVGDGCNTNLCYYGSNSYSPSPSGPMEYRSNVYPAAGAGVCKLASGFVCGNGANPSDNYFWNRRP